MDVYYHKNLEEALWVRPIVHPFANGPRSQMTRARPVGYFPTDSISNEMGCRFLVACRLVFASGTMPLHEDSVYRLSLPPSTELESYFMPTAA